jgi:hypothetical protein
MPPVRLDDRPHTSGTKPMFITSCGSPVNERRRHGPATLPDMLFMVIESFKDGDPAPIGERFRREGRMLPEGVVYHTSWMDASGARCFQIMEAPSRDSLSAWTQRWGDLVSFEIVPVLTSAEYWATRASS